MICYNLLKVLKFPTHVLSKRYPWVRECSSCFHYIPFIILKLKLTVTGRILLSPHSTEGGMGLYWIHPDVCLSVRLKTTRFPELFEKTIGSIHFIPVIYPYGVSLLTPIHFRVPSLTFGPLVAKYLAENGVSGTFFKKLLAQFTSFLAFTFRGWVSWPLCIFVFLASFSALWWPNIWPKKGFPELFEKTIGSFHFIPGIYPYGVSFLTPIHFRVPSLIFGPLVAKYLAENGVSGTFKKTISSIHFIPGIYPYGVSLLTPILFRVPSLIFLKNSHLCSTWLQNRNLYWRFLDEVGSDQSGSILSPFMGTACLDFFTQFMTNFNCIWFQGNFEFLLYDLWAQLV